MSTLPMNQDGYGAPVMQNIDRQRKLAEQLRQQSEENIQGQMVSGHYVAPSWTQQLARLVNAGTGAYINNKADKSEKDYAATKARKLAEFLKGNQAQTTQQGTTDTSTIPAYEPSQMDRFGSPQQGVERQPVVKSTPNMVTETPDQVQQRQRALAYQLAGEYGNTPEIQMAIGDMNHARDRGERTADIKDERSYTDNREEKLYNRNRADKLTDVEAEHKYEDIVRKDSQGFQLTIQDKQFAQQFQMQKQSQGFQAGQQSRSQAFQAGENQKSRDAALANEKLKINAPPKNKGLSVTAQKELIDAEDGIQGSKEAVKAFTKALSINDKAMGGAGSSTLATIGGVLPQALRPSSVDATKELDNVLQGSALPQLKAIFGGMPTEGERAILLEVQGSSNQPASVRKGIFERAVKAANNRIEYNSQKAKQLRNGTYFTEEGGISMPDETPAVTSKKPTTSNW